MVNADAVLVLTAVLWLLSAATARSVAGTGAAIRADERTVAAARASLVALDAAVDAMTARRRAGLADEGQVRRLTAERGMLLMLATPRFGERRRRAHAAQVRRMLLVAGLLAASVLLRVAAGVYGPSEVGVVVAAGLVGAAGSGPVMGAIGAAVGWARR